MSTVIQAYQFALDPNPEQEAALRSHCGGQRYAYNWGLAQVKANLGQRKAEKSYGIVDTELTPSLNWSTYSLRKAWNDTKNETAPWWSENSKEAYSSGLANLAIALGNWADSRTGKRKGPKMRFPKFKGNAPGARAGSPPARSARPRTAGTSRCPAWGSSARMSPHGSWPGMCSAALRGFAR
jgi:putative transposase